MKGEWGAAESIKRCLKCMISNSSSSEVTDGWKDMEGKCYILPWGSAIAVGMLNEEALVCSVTLPQPFLMLVGESCFSIKELGGSNGARMA